MKKASYILKSNYIFTSETLSYFKGAVVISGETILDVIKGDTGYEQYIDDQTQVIEYGDKLIMPGFIDAHTHFDQASDNLEPEDIPRFAQLGVIPSMQPAHITLTKTYFEQSMGERRSKLAYQHRNLLDSGATLALGTDAPCVSVNPFETLYYAITRSDFDGNPLTKNPDQAMTLAEALKAYTYGASCAVSASDRLGTLTPGKYADIVVVDGPLFRETPDTIRKHQAEATFSAGKIVYKKA